MIQVIKMTDFQNEEQLDTLKIRIGTNDISKAPVTPENRWEPLMVCLLNKLKEKYKPRLVVMGTPVANFMKGNVARWNEIIRNLVRSNPGELRRMDLQITLRMTDHLALTRDGLHFITLHGRRWIDDAFQTKIEELEEELRTTVSLARTSSKGLSRSPIVLGLWHQKPVMLIPLLIAPM